jgi:uncharacterized protein YgbK (DUF1537 family)
VRQAIADALTERHLRDLGTAAADLALITGGSGIALGLPDNFRRAGRLVERGPADALPAIGGHAAVLAGSCSAATLEQIARFAAEHPHHALDPLALGRGEDEAGRALAFAAGHLGRAPFLISASRPPAEVAAIQAALGRERAGALIEQAMARIARELVAQGVRRLVVAGGETSGAVVDALGVRALRIGPSIDPGVPWTVSLGEPPLALALKSGNFGAPDFFARAFRRLEELAR